LRAAARAAARLIRFSRAARPRRRCGFISWDTTAAGSRIGSPACRYPVTIRPEARGGR